MFDRGLNRLTVRPNGPLDSFSESYVNPDSNRLLVQFYGEDPFTEVSSRPFC